MTLFWIAFLLVVLYVALGVIGAEEVGSDDIHRSPE